MKKKQDISNEHMLSILDDIEHQSSKNEIPRILDKKTSLEEHIKFSICRLFVIFLRKNNKNATALQNITGIPKTRLSDITNYKISGYSLDRLVSFAEKLGTFDPQTREHLNLMVEVLDGPVRSVREAKQIRKDIRKIA